MSKLSITAIILTHNEEKNIKKCLVSIQDLCDQVIIVDSGSTDQTIEICTDCTRFIVTHPYVDHVSQWQWALTNLDIKNEWVIPLDADHIVSARLREEIVDVFTNIPCEVDGFYAQHKVIFMEKPLRGFKECSLRLFRREKTRIDASELVDFRFVVEGRTQKLRGDIYEDNKKEASIDFWIDKHQNFSTRMAIEEILRRENLVSWSFHPKLFGNHDQRIAWFKNIWYSLPLLIRPFLYFFYRYFVRLGILDGKAGLIYHFLQAFWFRFIVDIKILELKRKLTSGEITLDSLIEIHGHVPGIYNNNFQ